MIVASRYRLETEGEQMKRRAVGCECECELHFDTFFESSYRVDMREVIETAKSAGGEFPFSGRRK